MKDQLVLRKSALKWAACFLLILLFSAAGAEQVHAASRIVFPDRAYAGSKYVYVAIGIDGGGNIYRYNPSTRKKKCLAKGKYHSLTVKGKYIYCALNDYAGSDNTNQYIYRVSCTGKSKKKLANGNWPVVIGNKIYYLASSKRKEYGYTVDDRQLGIYSMNLNGTGKKKVYGGSDWYSSFGTDGKNHYFCTNGGRYWKVFNPKTKSVSDISLSGRSVNKTIRNFYYSGNLGSIRYGRKTYTYSGRNLYVTEKGKRKKVTRMGGTIKFLQPFKKYIFAVYEKEVNMGSWKQNKYYAVVMTVKGKKKKVITSGYNVSGGW